MVDRKDIGSWLSGPDTSGISKYPGERLGFPESGPGSMARAGRRILAIIIDWTIALLISNVFLAGNSMATLAVFAAEQILLIGTLGYGIGHRVMGIHVVRPDGSPAGPLADPDLDPDFGSAAGGLSLPRNSPLLAF